MCRGHIFTEHPDMRHTDVYAAVIPDFPYHAGVHVHYRETRLRIEDGRPKMKDVPKEMAGSGVSVAEERLWNCQAPPSQPLNKYELLNE
jgi:hypothetical protein